MIEFEGNKIYLRDKEIHAGFCLNVDDLSTDEVIDLKYYFINELEKRASRVFKGE